eukprot:3064748-Rhodomonas_salina.1
MGSSARGWEGALGFVHRNHQDAICVPQAPPSRDATGRWWRTSLAGFEGRGHFEGGSDGWTAWRLGEGDDSNAFTAALSKSDIGARRLPLLF